MLQGLIKRQMAFEHIFAAEGLTLSDAEIQQEYDEAARDFIEQKQEFDADRLREQATEMLKVRSGNLVVQTLRAEMRCLAIYYALVLTKQRLQVEHPVLIACGVCVWSKPCQCSSDSGMQFVANCSIQQHVGLAPCATKFVTHFKSGLLMSSSKPIFFFWLGLLLTRLLQCSFSALHMQHAGTKDHQVVAGQL